MKYIIKNKEPTDFIHWKKKWRAKNGNSLEDLYVEKGMTGTKLWRVLGSSKHEERLYSKEELKTELLIEQGFICCYCIEGIENNDYTTCEHADDKGTNLLKTFDYKNLIASCKGSLNDPPPKDVHCNLARGNSYLPLSPLDELTEIQFYFSADGYIKAHSEKAKNTIETLNLNSTQLIRKRKKAIDIYLFNDAKLIEAATAQTYADKNIFRKKDVEGKFIPFCLAIENVIKRDILNQKD